MCGLERLGHWPERAVTTLLDLGMTEAEIARYFGVELSLVRRVRQSAMARNAKASPTGKAKRKGNEGDPSP